MDTYLALGPDYAEPRPFGRNAHDRSERILLWVPRAELQSAADDRGGGCWERAEANTHCAR